MAKYLFFIPLLFSLTIGASQEQLETSDNAISQMIEPDNNWDGDEVLKNKAAEWAEQCINELNPQDREILCKMLEISYRFAYTDLKLKRAVRIVFDISCGIQDKLHRFIEITEDTVLLKKMTAIAADLAQEYNNNLQNWQQYVEIANQEQRAELLGVLKQADTFAQTFVCEYVNAHQKAIFEGLETAIVDNLKQGGLIKVINCSLLDNLNSNTSVGSDYTELLESIFEAARLQFCAEVKSIWKVRRLFTLQELLLSLRKDISYAFYQEAQAYIGQAR